MTTDHEGAEEFGEYVVYERLGMGGMATVHRAKKRGIAGYERGVALKRLLPHLAEDQEFIKSFVREAKLASMLVHPNIAQIYEFNRVGSTYYIAMEHVEGIDVRKILRYARRSGEVVPLPVVLSILAELCDALEYAHTYCDELGEHVGIVHRDVSPSNLIVSNNGHLKVIDFGIAKATRPSHNTEGGRIKGKVGYLSPEAIAGKNAGPPSDMFSVGVVAFELLTTRPLFWAKTDFETLTKIKELQVPPPSSINPAVPPDLDRLVLQALERKVSDRTQSAGDLRVGIDRIAQRFGYRLSSREVFDWISGSSGIESWATIKPAPRPLSQQQAAASASQLRPLPLPPPPEPERASRSNNSGRATSISQAAALVEQGHNVGSSDISPVPRNLEEDLVAELAWGVDGQSYPLLAGLTGVTGVTGVGLGAASGNKSSPDGRKLDPPATRVGVPRWGLPVALAAVLAVLAAFLLLRSPSPDVDVVITFAVQPEDSVIAIGGQPPNPAGTREVRLAPGVYSVSIHHTGYESWTENLTVTEGNPMAIGVTLKPKVENPSAEVRDPVRDPVPDPPVPAPPSPGDPTAPSKQGPDRADRAAPPDRGDRADRAERPNDGASSARQGQPTVRGAAGRDAVPVDAGAAPAASPDARESSPSEAPFERPVAVDAGAAPSHPPDAAVATPPRVPIVSSSKVTKLSGAIPELHMRSSANTPSDVVAKMCIDERGHVTKVETVRATKEIATQVERELREWKYKPYLAKGAPSPVCFPVSLRLIAVPSN